jgi:hypothetical protein
MPKPILAINAYAWDLMAEGPESSVESIRTLGCNRLLLSVTYRRARTFHPRHPTLRFCSHPHDYFDYTPDPSLYPEDFPLPPVNQESAEAHVVRRVRDACTAVNLRFSASIIGCHNSTIGYAEPALNIQNCYGDHYAFALCPSNPRVRQYLAALVEDVCRHTHPDAILLDSFGYLQAVHREHHELMFVRIGAAAEHLLSLCFCTHCRGMMSNPDRIAATCRRYLDTFLERESSSEILDREENAALLVEFPELYAVERARRQVCAELLETNREITQKHGVELDYITGLLARPSSRAWTEGNSLSSMASACDHVYLQSYFESIGQVEQDLRWGLANVPPEKLVLANMVGASHVQSEGDLISRVRLAAQAGLAGVSYYNYGLLNRRRLGWIRTANRTFNTIDRWP